MAVWMVRAGRYGEQESLALDKNLAVIGWEELPDLASPKSCEELKKLRLKAYGRQTDHQPTAEHLARSAFRKLGLPRLAGQERP